MADVTFGNDTITNIPTPGTISTNLGPDFGYPYSFNPFGTAGYVDGGVQGDITLRVLLTEINPPFGSDVDGESLYAIEGSTTHMIGLGEERVFVASDAAEAEAWIQNLFMLEYSGKDRFIVTLQARDAESGSFTSLGDFQYRISCYLRGTMISTPTGMQPVETLQIGDLVATLDGSAQPVKWIGHRTYEAAFGGAEPFVRPVLFRAGALGPNLPARDLRVSPQHAMLVDGVLVPAAALVNDVSIVRDTVVADVAYFHIELANHEIVFAEGAPAETFVDHDNRAMFDNADEYALLYGTAPAGAENATPRVVEGYQLAAIRGRLAQLAGIDTAKAAPGQLKGNLERIENGVLHGWVIDSANTTDAVEAEVLVEGEVVARLVANRYRADLDQADLAGGRCGFSVALPASAEALSQIRLRRATDGAMLGSAIFAFAAG